MPESQPFRLTLPPSPSHLATARLFSVAIARTFGLSEELVADIRLATSELATLAMTSDTGERITVAIDIGSSPPTLTVGPIGTSQSTTGAGAGIFNPMDVVTAVFPSTRAETDGRVVVEIREDATREQ